MAPARGLAPKRPSTKLFGARARRRVKGTEEEEAARRAAKRRSWMVPAGSQFTKRDMSKVVHRVKKPPPPPHEKTRRESAILRNEWRRQEYNKVQAEKLERNIARVAELAEAHKVRQAKFLVECAAEAAADAAAKEDTTPPKKKAKTAAGKTVAKTAAGKKEAKTAAGKKKAKTTTNDEETKTTAYAFKHNEYMKKFLAAGGSAADEGLVKKYLTDYSPDTEAVGGAAGGSAAGGTKVDYPPDYFSEPSYNPKSDGPVFDRVSPSSKTQDRAAAETDSEGCSTPRTPTSP
jgi:hypothetical protein